MTMRLANKAKNAAALAVGGSGIAATGVIEVYSGSQPATPDTAAGGTKLCHWNLSGSGVTWVAPAGGVTSITPATLPISATVDAAGTAGWFRIHDGSGNVWFDGTVTASGGGGDMTLTSTTIALSDVVQLTSLSFTVPQ